MKYENFEQIKKIVKKIDQLNKIVEDIEASHNVSFKLNNGNEVYESSLDANEHEYLFICKATKEYQKTVIELFNVELSKLHNELDAL